MLYPICNVELLLGEKQGIDIDYSPKCRGIWLDRCELEKIIERTMESSVGISHNHRNEYRESHHDDDEYKHLSYGNNKYKKKSFLEDLFYY
jgi:Zn-finger nucleic acid-binding protein